MKTIRMAYQQMWGDSRNFPASYMLQMFPYLAPHYQFVIDNDSPQFVFHSVYGYVTRRYPAAIRLVYAGEPGSHFAVGAKIAPGVTEPGYYHYGLTMDRTETHPDHLYLPLPCVMLSLYFGGISDLVRPEGYEPPVKQFFADFVYSNGNSQRRIDFFHSLSKYRRVESCGAVCRNNEALASAAYDQRGYQIKQQFQARCKFSISFENTVFNGYNTEKASDSLRAGSVPLYWGDPCIAELYNPDAMINVDDFASDDEAIRYIAAVDQDDALYQRYATAPPFRGNVVPDSISDARYLAFWQRILEEI